MDIPPKTKAEAFRKAAAAMERGGWQFSCNAVRHYGDEKCLAFYEHLYNLGYAFFDNRRERILALLLAAEIVERGQL